MEASCDVHHATGPGLECFYAEVFMDFLMEVSKLQSLGCRHKLLGKEPKVSFSKGDSAQFFVARIQDLIFFANRSCGKAAGASEGW